MKFGIDMRDKTAADNNKGFHGLGLVNVPIPQLMNNNIPK